MKAYLYTIILKTKLDLKSSEILITYYLVPLLFFAIMGTVFTSIMPESKETIIATMTIFSVTMGSLIGTPASIMEYFKNDLRKSFKSAGISMQAILLSSLLSGFFNLTVVSLIIYLISPMAFDALNPENGILYAGGFVLFLIATLLVGIVLGLFANNSGQLTVYSQVVFLPSMMLSGIMFPASMLPEPLQYLGMVFPATHGMGILGAEVFEYKHFGVLLLFVIISILVIGWKLHQLRYEDAK